MRRLPTHRAFTYIFSRALSTSSRTPLVRPRKLEEVGDKVPFDLKPLGKLSKAVPTRRTTHVTQRVGSMFGGNHSLEWTAPPRTVLIVKKPGDERTSQAMRTVIRHLQMEYPETNIVIEPSVASELPDLIDSLIIAPLENENLLSSRIDFIITLGGDGTALHTASLFSTGPVPPVLSFSMGTLGFLLPFHIDQVRTALADLYASRVSVLKRMRLTCSLHGPDGTELERFRKYQVMNEVSLHRGAFPHLAQIEIYVDGQALTEAVADGLIVSTPTGSSAYSLSAGGPLVHPSVQSLVVTPISPRSLSFRPLLLPSDTTVQLRIADAARAPPSISLDGQDICPLQPGEYIQVAMSPFPIPCINRSSASLARPASESNGLAGLAGRHTQPRLAAEKQLAANAVERLGRAEDDWVRDINDLLNFNSRFGSKGVEVSHAGDVD